MSGSRKAAGRPGGARSLRPRTPATGPCHPGTHTSPPCRWPRTSPGTIVQSPGLPPRTHSPNKMQPLAYFPPISAGFWLEQLLSHHPRGQLSLALSVGPLGAKGVGEQSRAFSLPASFLGGNYNKVVKDLWLFSHSFSQINTWIRFLFCSQSASRCLCRNLAVPHPRASQRPTDGYGM